MIPASESQNAYSEVNLDLILGREEIFVFPRIFCIANPNRLLTGLDTATVRCQRQ